MLKQGNSKTKGRELYRITDLFENNSETWAKIQKHESQFRCKEYEVKIAELLPLANEFIDKSSDNENNDGETIDTQQTSIEEHLDTAQTGLHKTSLNPLKRQPRKAAVQARKKYRKWLPTQYIKFKRQDINHRLTHGITPLLALWLNRMMNQGKNGNLRKLLVTNTRYWTLSTTPS